MTILNGCYRTRMTRFSGQGAEDALNSDNELDKHKIINFSTFWDKHFISLRNVDPQVVIQSR